MSFFDHFRSYFIDAFTQRFFYYHGRASRREFWWFYLYYIISFLMFIASVYNAKSLILAFLFTLYSLISIIPIIMLGIRRLHDIGLPGFVYLLNFIPYIGGLIFIVLACLPSQEGENKYGRNPYDDDEMACLADQF